MTFVKTRSIVVVFVVLGLFGWLTMARIVRGQVLSLKERDYVIAARAMGARPAWIIWKHMIPNVMGPVIVYATLMVPSLMLSESFLSFLGLGVSEPETSWGVLISEGAAALTSVKTYWWLTAFPGVCLALTLFCLNAVGDGLRDAFDVRSVD
jgi:oligopeptide transport system permease protein